MSMSAFQKVTLVSCLVLCVALLLPKMLLSRDKRDASQSDGSAGQFPPMLHRKAPPEHGPGGLFSRPHNPEAIARAKGNGAARGKSNLAGQIIPVYGFGILLYIIYIIFKITSKGKPTQSHENRFSTMRSEKMKRKITDFELTQLQERLKETEDAMERIVSRAQTQHGIPESTGPVSADQEETLLLQLREITRVMQAGQLLEGIPLESDMMDSYGDQDLEGSPDGTDYSAEAKYNMHFYTRRQGSSCQTEELLGAAAMGQGRRTAESESAFCYGENNPDDPNSQALGDHQGHNEECVITDACGEEVLAGERMTLESLLPWADETKYTYFHSVSASENKDASFSATV
ncbi:protein RIC-3b isoform X3 [Electrophorus electricus]|uniref:protein RIC-3b isoform X3 n=1 Tax=Electrophorus electricus TaxID=8005 RepID=UPI0015D011C0|nr:protein RIC-3b isoform X3 [Electrophorus electricus]